MKLYLSLNGALHDTAIAAWGAKRTYQAPRPISMIRYMAFQGQSSDPKSPSYNAEGLPLVPGLTKLVNGQVFVRTQHGWVLGTRWLPLRPTPPSPGWVSEGSAFAAAAHAVLGRTVARTAAQAAHSGLEAGIDIPADDTAGQKLGLAAGRNALALARRYFAGTVSR